MGYITNIRFEKDISLNGIKVRAGMSTQVRWDLGVGDFQIDGKGKIIPDTVYHGYPLKGDAKKRYEKEIANWSGTMDTNMGTLFFKEGQLIHLDLSVEGVGEFFCNHRPFGSKDNILDKDGLYRSLSPEATEVLETELNLYRTKLSIGNRDGIDAISEYAYELAVFAFFTTDELVDPHHMPEAPTGFIRA